MSEFSESYHLRSNNPREAIELLKRAHLKGYVFPVADGWVTFVAENHHFEPDPAVIRANRGLLLHYVSAEDLAGRSASSTQARRNAGTTAGGRMK